MSKTSCNFLFVIFSVIAFAFSAADLQATTGEKFDAWPIEQGGQEIVEVHLMEKSLGDLQDTLLPFGGVVEFTPREEKKFHFSKYRITIINDRDRILKLLLFINEGVPICAIIKSLEGYGSWGVHHALPNNSDAVIVINDKTTAMKFGVLPTRL